MLKLILNNFIMKIYLLIPDTILPSTKTPGKKNPKTNDKLVIGLGVPLLIRRKRDILRSKAKVAESSTDSCEKQLPEDRPTTDTASVDFLSSSISCFRIGMVTPQTKLLFARLQQNFRSLN